MKSSFSALVTLLVTLFLASPLLPQDNGRRTLAVLYFDNNSIADKANLDPLNKGMADMLITEMSQIEAFKVVERQRLQDLLSEMSLGQSGVIDEATSQKVGKLLGAQNLLLGSFMNMFGGKMRVDVRIVEVETGVTLKAVEETGKVDDLFPMIKKLTDKVAKYFKVQLTKQDKERLDGRSGGNLQETLLYSRGLDYEDAGRKLQSDGDLDGARQMYKKALQNYQDSLKKSPSFGDAKTKVAELQDLLAGLN